MMSESKKPEGENDQGGEINPADSTPDSGKPKASEEEAQAKSESPGEQTITEPATATARTVGKPAGGFKIAPGRGTQYCYSTA